MTKVIMEVSEKDEITVTNPRMLKDNYISIKIGSHEIILPFTVAEELQEAMEHAIVNETYWSKTLEKQVENLQYKIDSKEEML